MLSLYRLRNNEHPPTEPFQISIIVLDSGSLRNVWANYFFLPYAKLNSSKSIYFWNYKIVVTVTKYYMYSFSKPTFSFIIVRIGRPWSILLNIVRNYAWLQTGLEEKWNNLRILWTAQLDEPPLAFGWRQVANVTSDLAERESRCPNRGIWGMLECAISLRSTLIWGACPPCTILDLKISAILVPIRRHFPTKKHL